MHDLAKMNDIDDIRWVWETMDLSVRRLLLDKDFADAFCNFDFPYFDESACQTTLHHATGTTHKTNNTNNHQTNKHLRMTSTNTDAHTARTHLLHTELSAHTCDSHTTCYTQFGYALPHPFAHTAQHISLIGFQRFNMS